MRTIQTKATAVPLLTLAAIALLGSVQAADEETAKFGAHVGTLMKLEPKDCPAGVVDSLRADQAAVCGNLPGERGARSRQRIDEAVGSLALDAEPVSVSTWTHRAPSYERAAYWLGVASLEVLRSKDTELIALIVSGPYERCSVDTPFMPRVTESGGIDIGYPVVLEASLYPEQAAREKRDGSVAVALDIADDGSPSVRCIHHAQPKGYGFELSAIEEAMTIDAGFAMRDREGAERLLNVVVRFSKADERPRGNPVKYHPR